MSHDDGVYRCGKPDTCPVCWLMGPRTPECETRVRAEYGEALKDTRPLAVRLARISAPVITEVDE